MDLWGLEAGDNRKSLFKTSLGVRGALIIGGAASIGIVVNPNNLWDSGITVSLGIGTGFEVALVTPLNDSAATIIDLASSSADFSNPSSTADIEGVTNTAYASAGIGIASDLDTQTITGITTGSVGGGVYKEVTIAITVGEITESIYNTGAAVINGILNFSGMSRLIGNIEYKELDGIR